MERPRAAKARHIAGVWELRRSGAHSTISAVGPSTENAKPAEWNSSLVGAVLDPLCFADIAVLLCS